MNETSENWTFESRAEKAEKAYYADGNSLTAVTDNMKVTGNDIVNFIIKMTRNIITIFIRRPMEYNQKVKELINFLEILHLLAYRIAIQKIIC